MPGEPTHETGPGGVRRWHSRVTLKDLIDAGLLRPGQELQFGRRVDVRAQVTPQGTVLFKGVYYASPSSAGASVNGTSVNGWVAWRLQEKNANWITLADLRSRLQR
jgi:hypothetical protein